MPNFNRKTFEMVYRDKPIALLQSLSIASEESDSLLKFLRLGHLQQEGDFVELWVPKGKIDWDYYEQTEKFKPVFIPEENLRSAAATRQRFFDEYRERHPRRLRKEQGADE